MIKSEYYTFAKQWLKQSGIQIYSGSERILNDAQEIFQVKPIKTKIRIGEDLYHTDVISRTSDVSFLKQYGLKIISFPIGEKRWYAKQQVAYVIVDRNVAFGTVMTVMPSEHHIEIDFANKVLYLVGKNAYPNGSKSKPVRFGRKNVSKNVAEEVTHDREYYRQNYNKVIKRSRGFDVYSSEDFIKIPELPVIFSITGELVCIPQDANENVILIVGERGKGKTFLLNAISSRLFWKWGISLAHVNDSLNQYNDWALPQFEKKFTAQLRKIGEHPMPMPMVFLYPESNTFSNNDMFLKQTGISRQVSFPFNVAVHNWENTFGRAKKTWKMENSGMLFRMMAKENLFRDCKSEEDVIKKVAMYDLDKDYLKKMKISNNSKTKIIQVVYDLFNQKFIDIVTQTPAVWEVKSTIKNLSLKLHPIPALMAAGLVPVLKTDNLKGQPQREAYWKFIIDDLFQCQTEEPFFADNKIRTYIVADELTDIASTQRRDMAAQSLINIATQGRMKRMGLLATTQYYARINPELKENAQYCFCLRLKDQAKLIKESFPHITDSHIEQLQNLEKFQVMGITTEHFVAYDSFGNKRNIERDEVVIGISVPPLNQHTPPRKMVET